MSLEDLLARDFGSGRRLKLLCFQTNVAFYPCVEAAFDGLRVAFQRGFSPAEIASFVGDLDEEPSRGNTKVFDFGYLAHSVDSFDIRPKSKE